MTRDMSVARHTGPEMTQLRPHLSVNSRSFSLAEYGNTFPLTWQVFRPAHFIMHLFHCRLWEALSAEFLRRITVFTGAPTLTDSKRFWVNGALKCSESLLSKSNFAFYGIEFYNRLGRSSTDSYLKCSSLEKNDETLPSLTIDFLASAPYRSIPDALIIAGMKNKLLVFLYDRRIG